MALNDDSVKCFKPRVSLGLPVYNGESSVGMAISSVLFQTHTCFELVISDNASTDGTEVICRDFASSDPRIRYTRQPRNLGAAKNFQWVFDNSSGDCFMWLGADDALSSSYIEDNLAILASNPEAVSSMTFLHDDATMATSIRREHLSLESPSPGERISAYLRHPGTNDRFYSLHRRWALEKCLPLPYIVANDWLLVVRLLMLGTMACRRANSVYRKSAGGASSSYRSLMKSYGKTGLSSLFPLMAFTAAIYQEVPFNPSAYCFAIKHLLEISVLRQSRIAPLLRRSHSMIKSANKLV
jgi:glycosyltransferase involved in cell wall biosynthesis